MGIAGHTPLTITLGPRLWQMNMAVGTSVAVSCEGRLHRCNVCKGVVAQHFRFDKHHGQNEWIHVWDRKCPIKESMLNITLVAPWTTYPPILQSLTH